MRQFFKRIVDVANALVILGLLVAYLAPFIDPQDFWPAAFFGLTYKFWFILNLVLIFFWILFKRKHFRECVLLKFFNGYFCLYRWYFNCIVNGFLFLEIIIYDIPWRNKIG